MVMVTPADGLKLIHQHEVGRVLRAVVEEGFSAVARFRRSDSSRRRRPFSFVLENFGMAMVANNPMITTTDERSIRVKPFRDITADPPAPKAPSP